MPKEKVGKSEKKLWQKILKGILIAVGVIVAAVVIFLIVMTIAEFRPEDEEAVTIEGDYSKDLKVGDSLDVMSWNIGYGALGADADFFMDGGKDVMSSTTETVYDNLAGISKEINAKNPDIILLQEVDIDSKRSHNVNEYSELDGLINGYQSTFAYNYVCLYVPYPMPPIGKVNCGIATFSKYGIDESTRIALPCPFTWPMRLANLKRCVDVNRISLDGSDKELVVVNLHLEAYDDGEGKILQTAMLKDILQKEYEAGNYVIAGGDFNQTFSNVDMTNFPVLGDNWQAGIIDVNDFGEDFTLIMDDSQASCRLLDKPFRGADPESVQYYVIDGFIVSNNISINEMSTIPLQYENSDHNPIVMNITLNE